MILLRIYAFLFQRQVQPIARVLTPRRARGVFEVPINNRGSRHKPEAFVATTIVIRALSLF
jgi:hypothetical protein